MNLDIHTILVMFALLAFIQTGLLTLAGLHAGPISSGIRQWALASFCISLGLLPAYFFRVPVPGYEWAVVLGSVLIAAGIGLQYTGIRTFKGQSRRWDLAVMLVLVALLQNLLWSVLQPDVGARSIANSLLFGAGCAVCARALLIRIEAPLRTAYWFTGAAFTLLAASLWLRAIVIGLAPPDTYNLYTNTPLNAASFFISSVVQLCVTFGFVLMVNYRLMTDIQKIASRDMLTGAFTRRRLEEEALRLLARCMRTGDVLAIMMIDVDHFKSVNDRYGHPVGDTVLRHLAAIAQHAIRTDDYFARYGGEEFCILLLSTTEQEALVLAERLREAYAALTLEVGFETLKSTISIGVADSIHAGLDWIALISAADQALYRAKQAGRNRVVSYTTLMEPAQSS
jgi:diguanylate cyclase (GGDEF)-like protein